MVASVSGEDEMGWLLARRARRPNVEGGRVDGSE